MEISNKRGFSFFITSIIWTNDFCLDSRNLSNSYEHACPQILLTHLTCIKEPYFLFEGQFKYRVIENDCRGFNNLSLHNTLDIAVCSCTDGSRNSQSFLLWCAECSSYALLRLERSWLRWRRTAIETITADMLQTDWNELYYRVDVCRITKGAHIEHL
jgi:hypothetical protein